MSLPLADSSRNSFPVINHHCEYVSSEGPPNTSSTLRVVWGTTPTPTPTHHLAAGAGVRAVLGAVLTNFVIWPTPGKWAESKVRCHPGEPTRKRYFTTKLPNFENEVMEATSGDPAERSRLPANVGWVPSTLRAPPPPSGRLPLGEGTARRFRSQPECSSHGLLPSHTPNPAPAGTRPWSAKGSAPRNVQMLTLRAKTSSLETSFPYHSGGSVRPQRRAAVVGVIALGGLPSPPLLPRPRLHQGR